MVGELQGHEALIAEIRGRVAHGATHTPEQMRADLLYLLRAYAQQSEVVDAVLQAPENAPKLDAAATQLLQTNMKRILEDNKNLTETNALMDEKISNLERWIRQKFRWSDELLARVAALSPDVVRAWFEAQTQKPPLGAPGEPRLS